MGMAAILYNCAEPFEQIVNMYILVKIGQAVSEKKAFKDFMILYLYIAQEQRHVCMCGCVGVGGVGVGEGAKNWS